MKGVRGFPLAPFLYLNCIMYTNTLSPMKLAFEDLAHAVFLPPVVSLPPVAFAACGIFAACGGFTVTRFWFFILGPDLHCRGGGVSTRVKGGAFPCSAFILDTCGRAPQCQTGGSRFIATRLVYPVFETLAR